METPQDNEVISQAFIASFNDIQRLVNQTAHDKGWYESSLADQLKELDQHYVSQGGEICTTAWRELGGIEDARRIALMHSELSEGLEGLRHGNPPSDHIPEFSSIEEELADCIIRIMDVSQERGWKVAEAIEAKRKFNNTRTHRHGGKKF